MNERHCHVTLIDLLTERSRSAPQKRIFTFLRDGREVTVELTYAGLYQRAQSVAASLESEIPAGERVLLGFPPGLDFIAAFFGCAFAGVIGVPAIHPGNKAGQWRHLESIVRDCDASRVLMPAATAEAAGGHLSDEIASRVRALDSLEADSRERAANRAGPVIDDIAYLQYTSGSTSQPRGVCVSHRNVVHNLAAIESAFAPGSDEVILSWLPHYHDQGLVGNILLALWLDVPAFLMPPVAFLQQPVRWLQAISERRATISGGPNFAFDLCVDRVGPDQMAGLDLSRWAVAYNGAEPIRRETLARFVEAFSDYGLRREAMAPAYGLAESTLAVSCCPRGELPVSACIDAEALAENRWHESRDGVELMSSGPLVSGQTVVIVDPTSERPCPEGVIGEICVSGASVAAAYWGDEERSRATFGLALAEYPGHQFLRTGDLGYLCDGELFVTGRMKDVIIVRGRNHYPQDIERSVCSTHKAFRAAGTAAFSVERSGGSAELIVLQEIERVAMRRFDADAVAAAVRERVAAEHELAVADIVFIRPATLPKTSSGKVRRGVCRQLYLDDELAVVAVASREPRSREEPDAPSDQPTAALLRIAGELTGCDPNGINPERSLQALGLDSMALVRFQQRAAGELGYELPLERLIGGASLATLARCCVDVVPAAPVQARRDQAGSASHGGDSAVEDEFPLAPNQRSLWLAQRVLGERPVFHLVVPLVPHGGVDEERLRSAWQRLLERHPLLRARVIDRDDSAQLSMAAASETALRVIDATETTDDEIAASIRAQASLPLAQAQAPPVRLHVWRRRDHAVLAILAHHLVVDLWSLQVVLDDLLALYGTGRASGSTPTHYAAYIRARLTAEADTAHARCLAYWRDKLSTPPEPLRLPYGLQRPRERDGHAASVYFELAPTQTQSLAMLARTQNTTLHCVVLAAYWILLARYSGQDDLIIGGSAAGRDDPRFDTTVGYFVNTVVYRLSAEQSEPFLTLLERVRTETAHTLAHQHAPFDAIVREAGVVRQPGCHPLYQASFSLLTPQRLEGAAPLIINPPKPRSLEVQGQRLSTFPMEQHSVQADLALTVSTDGDALLGRLDFATDVVDRDTAQTMANGLAALLASIGEAPDTSIGALPIEPSPMSERDARPAPAPPIVDGLDTVTAFRRAAAQHPNVTALIHGAATLSYAELDVASERCARSLAGRGIGPGDRVVLFSSRTCDWVIALLGILKAGAVYVPLDPSLPSRRIEAQLEQLDVALALDADGRFAGPDWLSLDALVPPAGAGTGGLSASALEGPAYILFTSGTSGTPKGAIVGHRSLTNRLAWMRARIALAPGERVLQKAPVSFDVSLWELLWPLTSGGCCVLVDDEQRGDPAGLADIIQRHGVTTAQFVPSLLSVFLEVLAHALPSPLQRIVCGGEPLTRGLAQRLAGAQGQVELHNLYGPTETGFVTHEQVATEASDAPVTLGYPIAGADVRVLGDDGRPAPPGALGELCIGGAALGQGYLDPAATQASLVQAAGGDWLYRSGDLGWRLPDGRLQLLGRRDDQVKLRGYRLALGEIEAALLACPGVANACAAVDGAGDRARLVAYLVGTDEGLDVEAVRAGVSERLPRHLCPERLMTVPALPLNRHGKVDRAALPELEPTPEATQYSPPRTEVERTLAGVWEELLGVSRIDRNDDFFALGGHSLLAARLAGRVRDLWGELPDIQLVFRHPCLSAYATAVQPMADRAACLSGEALTGGTSDDYEDVVL